MRPNFSTYVMCAPVPLRLFGNQSTCSGTKCGTCMPGGSAILKIIMEMLKMALQIPRLNGRSSETDVSKRVTCLPLRHQNRQRLWRIIVVIIIVVAIAVIISVQYLYHHPHPRPVSLNIINIIIIVLIIIIIIINQRTPNGR